MILLAFESATRPIADDALTQFLHVAFFLRTEPLLAGVTKDAIEQIVSFEMFIVCSVLLSG